MIVSDECLSILNAELLSVEDVATAEQVSRQNLGALKNRYLENFRTACGEIGVLKNRIPHTVEELRGIKGVLADFIKVSEEVYEAQTFKTQLDRIEADLNRLKVVESCLLVAQSFDANLKAFETFAKRIKNIDSTSDERMLTKELSAEIEASASLLSWWSECENNQKIIEAFGQWRFSKFAKIESEIRRIMLQHLRKELSKILESSEDDIDQEFLKLTQTYTVLCENYAESITATLLDWHHKGQILEAAISLGPILFKIMTRQDALNLINRLINAELRLRKNNLEAIQTMLRESVETPTPTEGGENTTTKFEGEFAEIEWGSCMKPVQISLNKRYIDELYKYHISQILMTLPITVRSTMQALNVAQDIRLVLKDIKQKFATQLPSVYEALKRLFNTLPLPSPSVPIMILREEVVQAITQNVYHPLTTAFPSHRATVSSFLALVHYIESDVVIPISDYIKSLFPRDTCFGDTTNILAPLKRLILSSTAEEIKKAYSGLITDYINHMSSERSEGPTPEIQKISSFTMDLLRQLFEDTSEQAQEIDTELIPEMLASLLELFLNEIGQSNISESINKCYVTGIDVITLLKLVDSLIVPDDNREKMEGAAPTSAEQTAVAATSSEPLLRLNRAHRELRAIAHACSEALGSESSKAQMLTEGLRHISDRR